jgi:hypothetical protein
MLRETAMGDDWSIAYGEPQTAEAKQKAANDWRQMRLRNYIAAVTGAPWGTI